MRQRDFIGLLGCVALAWPIPADAQQRGSSSRVAVLSPFSPGEAGFETFRRELQRLGRIEGQNSALEIRYANGRLERLPELARELVSLKPDVIFAGGEQGLAAAKQAAADTPIVVIACDPLDRLIVSLAAPGGSATGLSCVSSELAGKRLELLKEFVPGLVRVSALYNPSDPNKRVELAQLEAAGRQLGITITSFEVTDATSIAGAFAAMTAARMEALVVLVDPFMIFHRQDLADLALRQRLPTAFGFKEFVEAGGLLSYGASRSALFRRAAAYVDKILNGEKPGDLPVEEPTTFELYINRKTADALGLTIPASLHVRADEMIE
jgi:putative tryptophan/tyrosine transport system substrate-binding protein